MATMINELYLNRQTYGPNHGRLVGSLKIGNELGEFELNLSQEQVVEIVRLVAGALVESAKEVSALMTAQVIEDVERTKALGSE